MRNWKLNFTGALSSVFMFLLIQCGGKVPGLSTNEPIKVGDPKYDSFFEKADKFEANIKDAKETLKKAQAELAVACGLTQDASLNEIKAKIKQLITESVVKAGGHIEVKIEGGIFASAQAEGSTSEGVSAGGEISGNIEVTIEVVGEVEMNDQLTTLIEAAKTALKASAGVATKLKPLGEEGIQLGEEALKLSASVPSDIKDPILAAKVTNRLKELGGIFKEAAGLYDTSFNFTIELKASFTLEAGAEASAGT